ncbi:uncharacterized protein PHALS_00528 [Plasmopara halstedii]|uniref:Uncharacterized protein n=1 Tax=Plasmopara halstedii TaxID=4781 RepID=A0A0P1A6I1_PLAHL|nr:uncharacterized protein PHALS_00528 [Plasmopara halstedii]CEG36207.1 hypothetical protein PHALS_00528 [Plasmopara halstedii]|eukprot:XP_024572576.1 hypothetical protein PHALS_00528 [Plasmopara halstedii]
MRVPIAHLGALVGRFHVYQAWDACASTLSEQAISQQRTFARRCVWSQQFREVEYAKAKASENEVMTFVRY